MIIVDLRPAELARAMRIIRRNSEACLFFKSGELRLEYINETEKNRHAKKGTLYGVYTEGVSVTELVDDIRHARRCEFRRASKAHGLNCWSEEDDRLLKIEYGKTPTKELARRLGRTVSAVRKRASRVRQLETGG